MSNAANVSGELTLAKMREKVTGIGVTLNVLEPG